MLNFFLIFNLSLLLCCPLWAAPQKVEIKGSSNKLNRIKAKIDNLENKLSNSKKVEAGISKQLSKLESLLKLQALEIELGNEELAAAEEKIKELEMRSQSLKEAIEIRKDALKRKLSYLPITKWHNPISRTKQEGIAKNTLLKNTLQKIVVIEKAEIIGIKAKINDLKIIEEKISDEKFKVLAHIGNLKHKQAILKLNKQNKGKLLSSTRSKRMKYFQSYQAAKASEMRLEKTMGKITKEKRNSVLQASDSKLSGFTLVKGKLPMPVWGKVISRFGKKYDSKTSLYSFQKGITIKTQRGSSVKAIYAGEVVYTGRLGGYGRIIIIDHGNKYYSLVGQLGEIIKKQGEKVAQGDLIGRTSLDSTPLYFEIRKRHIAINPMPWLKKIKQTKISSR